MRGLRERIAGLPGWPVWMDGTSAVSTDSQEMDAALARLALAREWIECHPHEEWCELYKNEIDQFLVCRCGRDALLKALEVPK